MTCCSPTGRCRSSPAAADPARAAIDTWDGSAWLGVVPFRMTHVRPLGVPLPGGRFAYARSTSGRTSGPGRPGVWFFSAPRAGPPRVWAARRAFHLPYWYARVGCAAPPRGRIDFASRHDGERTALFRGRYRPTGPCPSPRAGSFEAFLTERLCLYAARGRGGLLRADVEHGSRGRSSRPSSSRRSTPWPPRTGSRCRTRRPTCSSHAGSRSPAAERSGSPAVAMTPTRR